MKDLLSDNEKKKIHDYISNLSDEEAKDEIRHLQDVKLLFIVKHILFFVFLYVFIRSSFYLMELSEIKGFENSIKDYTPVTVTKGAETTNGDNEFFHYTYKDTDGNGYDVMFPSKDMFSDEFTIYVNKDNKSDYLYRDKEYTKREKELMGNISLSIVIYLFITLISHCINSCLYEVGQKDIEKLNLKNNDYGR